MTFRNRVLSYSRLSRYEACPAAFKFHYIDRLPPSDDNIALRFGKATHAALEGLVREAVEQNTPGPLNEERAIELFAAQWPKEQLSGLALFAEGVAILRDFVRTQKALDPGSVLGLEKEFRIPVGRFEVLGYLDRVDRIDDETIEIIDYKTNRQLFTREQVDESLQMSIYALAARALWPWARTVKLTFWMLRHSVRMVTTRSEQQLDDASKYVQMLGNLTEESTEYPARVGSNCVYCDQRAHCPEYAKLLSEPVEVRSDVPQDLEAVARERETVAARAKILYARKGKLEDVLRQHLRDRDDLVIAGTRYSLIPTTSTTHPLGPTLRVLQERTPWSREELVERLAVVDKDALDALMRDAAKTLEPSKVRLLKAEIDAVAERTVSPRFFAREVRS